MTKWNLFLECKNCSRYKINIIHHISRIKGKDHLIDAEKVSDKIQHSFMVKTQQTKNRGNYINIIKPINEMPTANIILNNKKLHLLL